MLSKFSLLQNIFIINLERRKNLMINLTYISEYIKDNFSYINIERIQGIDGREEYEKDNAYFNKLLVNKKVSLLGYGFRTSKIEVISEIACFLSHRKCWQKIVDENLDITLILEDGMKFNTANFTNKIEYSDSDIIFVNKEMVNNNGKLEGYGFQGYIVTLKGARKLLEQVKCLINPVDFQVRYLCNKGVFKWSIMNNNWTENDKERISTISSRAIYKNNEKTRENFNQLYIRIINNMIHRNIDVAEFL